ncbi:hypothetical protein HK097_000901 [Rhizophlyctis rosea]|uniref:Uncharacterized protein n=1 Tax=Rhizophlyctis rosea TaxID=64517 RepID=A0AAD5S4Z9_9FUNG|nr:hypothetical protein HK097_000901 [Rhizophlyctis rosea]
MQAKVSPFNYTLYHIFLDGIAAPNFDEKYIAKLFEVKLRTYIDFIKIYPAENGRHGRAQVWFDCRWAAEEAANPTNNRCAKDGIAVATGQQPAEAPLNGPPAASRILPTSIRTPRVRIAPSKFPGQTPRPQRYKQSFRNPMLDYVEYEFDTQEDAEVFMLEPVYWDGVKAMMVGDIIGGNRHPWDTPYHKTLRPPIQIKTKEHPATSTKDNNNNKKAKSSTAALSSTPSSPTSTTSSYQNKTRNQSPTASQKASSSKSSSPAVPPQQQASSSKNHSQPASSSSCQSNAKSSTPSTSGPRMPNSPTPPSSPKTPTSSVPKSSSTSSLSNVDSASATNTAPETKAEEPEDGEIVE